MVSNRWRGLISLALLWGTLAALSAQEPAEPEETPVAEVAAPNEVVVDPNEAVMARMNKLEEELNLGIAQSDVDILSRLEHLQGQINRDRTLSWVPLLMMSLLLLTPIALFMLGRSLTQRLSGQVDELKRQRLQLESVDESLRELPAKLPKPAFDTSELADSLRKELRQPAPAPVTPPPVVATPFYQNAQWLASAAEPPRRYLDYLAELRQAVNQIHVELTDSDNPGEALALVGWMLARFYERQSACPAGQWRQLLQVAEETGYVNDPALGDRLSKSRSDEEAARTLHRALYREVLEQGISDHLILLEEIRHLPNFCGAEASHATCQAISQRIDALVETFLSQTRRLAGYTPNHVPLFSEFTEESAQFLRNNPAEKLPRIYQSLELPRRQVLCVLAYGLRRERGWENEETQVILS